MKLTYAMHYVAFLIGCFAYAFVTGAWESAFDVGLIGGIFFFIIMRKA